MARVGGVPRPGRFDRLRLILSLDPLRDRDRIFRLLTTYEFPWDFARALQIALFRTYAVPSIGRLLDRTGEFTRRPRKRIDDTALLLYEILHHGVDDRRGQQAIRHLNGIHGLYPISDDDHRYTLATFVVMPVRWIGSYGWRRLHPREVLAITHTMRGMGEQMGIPAIPETYAEFERLLDDYERRHFAFDPAARRVALATLEMYIAGVPRPLAGLARALPRLVLDHHVLDAFGLPRPPAPARRAVHLALRTRAALLRVGPARPDSRPAPPPPQHSYPHGYALADLGPCAFHRARPRPD